MTLSTAHKSKDHTKTTKQKEHIKSEHDMRFPAMWYVQPTKVQISLRKRAVWSETLLIA